jgi:hypothetical protein
LSIFIAAAIIAIYLLFLRMRWQNIQGPELERSQPKISVRVVDTSKPETARHSKPSVEAKNRYCSFCGEKIRIDSKYCDKCGAEQ